MRKEITKKQQQIVNILAELPEKYVDVLIQRWYEGKTQEKVGEYLRITNERVRQIEEEAIQIITRNLQK